MSIRQYGGGKPSILEKMQPYTISYTQAEAGFKVVTTEKFLTVKFNYSGGRIVRYTSAKSLSSLPKRLLSTVEIISTQAFASSAW